MGAKPPFNGELGTGNRPTAISTDVLELLTTDVDSLVGLARDSAAQQDGAVVYASDSGAPTDLAVWVDGVKRPVTSAEWVDSNGTHRPVTEWHLGPLGEFALTLNSLTFVQPPTFDVAVASTTSPVKPGNTLDVTADITNAGDETGTQTVTLDIDNGVGQVDSQAVAVGAGGSTTTTLSWAVPSGQSEQDYTATVASDDDSDSTTVTVIPSSVELQYAATTYSGGDATWTDDTGTADMSLTGTTATTLSDGSDAVSADGTDDKGKVTMPTSLEGADLNNQSIEFAIQTSTSEEGGLIDVADGSQICIIELNQNKNFNDDVGNFYFLLDDDDGNRLVCSPSSNPNLNDGARHDVSVIVNDASKNDVDIIIDGNTLSLSFGTSNNPDNFSTWSNDCNFFQRDGGSSHLSVKTGAVRWHSEALNSQTINNYPF